MRRWSSITLAIVALLVAAAACAAPQSVSLELKGQPGDEATYDTQIEFEMDFTAMDPQAGGRKIELSPRASAQAVTTNRVTAVARNGDLTMQTQVNSFSLEFSLAELRLALALEGAQEGKPALIKLPPIPFQTVVSKRGKTLAITGLDKISLPFPGPGGQKMEIGALISQMLEQFSQPLFPDRSVSVGDTWEWEMVIDPAAMVQMMGVPLPPEASQQMASLKFPIRNTSKLLGFEMVNGVECAKIESLSPWELTMPMPGDPSGGALLREGGTTKVTTWLDYQRGVQVRSAADVTVEMTVTAGEVTPAQMSMVVTAESNLLTR